MRNRLLTEVPHHIVDRPTNVISGMKWQSNYNVAAWFRFRDVDSEPLTLLLQWSDESGNHKARVDKVIVSSGSMMVSGVARLCITGPLEHLSVAIETLNETFRVDELFVQPFDSLSVSQQA